MLARKYDYPFKLAAELALRKLRLVQLFGLKLVGNKLAAGDIANSPLLEKIPPS